MKERLPPAPDPEMGAARPCKTHDLEYRFQGLQRAAGVARIRIFERPALGVPLVLATELPQNTGPSITNLCEYLAWEIAAAYLPGRVEFPQPFDWVEHYPADAQHPSRHRRTDTFALVRFADYMLRVESFGQRRRVRIGTPTWMQLSHDALASLLEVPLYVVAEVLRDAPR